MTSSRSVSLRGSQEPRVAVFPRARTSDADDAAFLSSSYGLTPDSWQYTVLDGWLARRGDGRWAATTAGCAVPRQNGKNGILEVVELYFMIGLGLRVLHTAHEVKTARKAFIRLCSFFENERKYPELTAMVKDIRRTNGQEAILLTNGGSVEFIARSKGSGRGYTVDALVCDEAQELTEDALEALTPTTSAAPSGDPMTIFTGTPPGPAMHGEVWTRIRKGALDGTDRRIAWFEWSIVGASPDLDDRALWAATNPALGGRLNIETLEMERNRFTDAGFARERLGMWASEQTLAIIPAGKWDALKVTDTPDGEPSAFGLDMSPDRNVSIGVCVKGDPDHVEVAALDKVQDTAGVVEWLVERAGSKVTVVVDQQSPAASMVPALRAAGVKVNVTSAGDMSKACGAFYDAALEGRLTHFDQEPLNHALAGARKRKIGDAGGWGWDRKNLYIDISPLVAVTLARFGSSVAVTKQPSAAFAF